MAPQTDKPNTTGFLCHTCIWRARAESHELMDIEALMRHGQRYHYLQADQIGDYLKAAYCVTRDPDLCGRTRVVPFKRIYEKVREGAGLYGRGLKATMSDWEERVVENSSADNALSGKSLGAVGSGSSEGFTSVNEEEGSSSQATPPNYPIIQSSELERPGDEPNSNPSHSSALVKIPESGSWEDPFPAEILTNLDLAGEVWNLEAVNLFHFDHELASLPYFATQLHEYMEAYGVSEEGIYLGIADEIGGKSREWEGDRLQVWPGKTVPELEMLEQGGKVEEDGEIEWVPMLEFNFGEAGDYMDMRDIDE